MWNITSDDIQRAKDRLEHRRAALAAKYAEDKKALDDEFAAIETLERVASEFALKRSREDVAAASEPPAEIYPGSGGDAGSGRDILKPGSRWRLHLGNRPSDAEGMASDAASPRGENSAPGAALTSA